MKESSIVAKSKMLYLIFAFLVLSGCEDAEVGDEIGYYEDSYLSCSQYSSGVGSSTNPVFRSNTTYACSFVDSSDYTTYGLGVSREEANRLFASQQHCNNNLDMAFVGNVDVSTRVTGGRNRITVTEYDVSNTHCKPRQVDV